MSFSDFRRSLKKKRKRQKIRERLHCGGWIFTPSCKRRMATGQAITVDPSSYYLDSLLCATSPRHYSRMRRRKKWFDTCVRCSVQAADGGVLLQTCSRSTSDREQCVFLQIACRGASDCFWMCAKLLCHATFESARGWFGSCKGQKASTWNG